MTENAYINELILGTPLADVSRETMEALEAFALLLVKWNKKINLISASSEGTVWQRHILDSAQLFPLIHRNKIVMDVGAGAGFPGLILSIMGVKTVHLAEADERKAVFLQQAARISPQSVVIHNKRVEHMAPFPVDYITARAMASIDRILTLTAEWNQSSNMEYLLLKGRRYQEELEEAAEFWDFESSVIPSISDLEGAVVRLKQVRSKTTNPKG